ncbi:metallophosphoesterase family protein [Oceanomicrobium pacificus]|uniref:Serine/threonine protein phosphatase n=1 Tax=Oceanomicrobium pacificus TaxID=2692916 RepID=A0A6B0U282_9RHOB|nr:metallophosphoesterase family protein [Oceanomicrobium pacificus]MXU65141.1 serine/threonine protein phosphatase [Oceanomicrobium pacificus]
MLSWFRKRPAPAHATFDPPAPAHPHYAIGDVHGCATLLDDLLGQIAEVQASRGGGPHTVVAMGDYVDRGEDSRAVLDRLMAEQAADTADRRTVCLMGNHEAMLLDFLEDPDDGALWLRNGGLQTLASFGVALPPASPEGMAAASDALREAVGPARLAFLRALDLTYRSGNLVFSHAGLDPDLPADEQSERACLWGTSRSLSQPRGDGIWVVHGHYAMDEPHARDGRIATDTGAVHSGRLTCAQITDGTVGFLST